MKNFFICLSFTLMLGQQAVAQESIVSDRLSVQNMSCPNNRGYKVHLSFDDGPNIPHTERILDTLKRRGVKATFLISTNRFRNMANGNPPNQSERRLLAIIDRMKKEGHTIGNHSFEHWDHTDLNKYTEEQIRGNMERSYRVMDQLNLDPPVPFRFPYGSGWLPSSNPRRQSMNGTLMSWLNENGYRPFHWDLDTEDWSKQKRKALPGSLLHQVCNSGGGVALMHDIHSWTAENLDAMIESLQISGHEMVSYREIVRYDKRSTRANPNVPGSNQGAPQPPPRPERFNQPSEWSGGLY